MAVDITPKKEQPQYPFMQISFPPQGGILLTVVYSAFEKHDIIIPPENATAMCVAYMAQQPGEAIKQMLQLRKEAQKQHATLQAAMSNPRGLLKAVN